MTASPSRLPAYAGSRREGTCNRRRIPVLAGGLAAAVGASRIELGGIGLPRHAGAIEAAGWPGDGPAAAGGAA